MQKQHDEYIHTYRQECSIHLYMCMCMCMCMCMWMWMCMYVYMYHFINVHVHMHVCIYMYNIYIYTYIYIYIHIRHTVYLNKHICIYLYTPSNTQIRTSCRPLSQIIYACMCYVCMYVCMYYATQNMDPHKLEILFSLQARNAMFWAVRVVRFNPVRTEVCMYVFMYVCMYYAYGTNSLFEYM
jgi:hypothetical protein